MSVHAVHDNRRREPPTAFPFSALLTQSSRVTVLVSQFSCVSERPQLPGQLSVHRAQVQAGITLFDQRGVELIRGREQTATAEANVLATLKRVLVELVV